MKKLWHLSVPPSQKTPGKPRFLPVLLTLLHLLSSAGCSPLPCAFVLQHIRILGQTPSLKNVLYNIPHFCLIFSSSAADISGNFPLRVLPFDHARVSYKHYVKTGLPQFLINVCRAQMCQEKKDRLLILELSGIFMTSPLLARSE